MMNWCCSSPPCFSNSRSVDKSGNKIKFYSLPILLAHRSIISMTQSWESYQNVCGPESPPSAHLTHSPLMPISFLRPCLSLWWNPREQLRIFFQNAVDSAFLREKLLAQIDFKLKKSQMISNMTRMLLIFDSRYSTKNQRPLFMLLQ